MVSMRRRVHSRGRRSVTGVAAALMVTAVAAGPIFAPAASARVSAAKAPKPTVVVKAVTVATFGQILVTKTKLPLYTFDMGTCSAATSCSLTIWPPLLMPKGKTVPAGATGLGTQPFGTGKLQVTYHGSPLYTFYLDHKDTVTGDGQGGFTVAHVTP